ncbi:cytochrome P450 [Stachybotrys elegans]|uniref:Cytochrome P450 n=1 Tax=Stachybotrys elegans TaxID=80388 RepID=A0A8K0SH95_9HYPO|nr:cytochrome P450 [Stachybotrys elegans]
MRTLGASGSASLFSILHRTASILPTFLPTGETSPKMLIPALLIAASVVIAAHLYTRLRHKRFEQFAGFPQLPPSLIWGHMLAFDEFTKRGKQDRHPDLVFADMHKAIGSPPLMLADMRPVQIPVVIVSSHDIAEQVSKSSNLFPWSLPKTPSIVDNVHLIGSSSIISAEGEKWRDLRKRFAPGFAPGYLMGLLPCILDNVEIFINHLDDLARSQQEFSLTEAFANLTIDIISSVVMQENVHAQSTEEASDLVRDFRALLATYSGKHNVPRILVPGLDSKRRGLSNKVDSLLEDIVIRKFKQYQNNLLGNETRSILSLSFQDIDTLTPDLIEHTSHQVKSFLFAGHGTTSILLSWTFYELSRTPSILKSLCTELDEVFGPDTEPRHVISTLRSGGKDFINHLPYTSAVIKEILRLHPPAGTGRYSPPGTGFKVRTQTGQEYCLDGTIVYICHTIIHRDPAIYGDTVNDFIPERWLGDAETSDAGEGLNLPSWTSDGESTRKFPPGAWRPFERGPRNCIGQELANIEARVIVATVARSFSFVKAGLGEMELGSDGLPLLNSAGQYNVKSELYPTLQVTIKPVDGMRMRVKHAAYSQGVL